MMVGVIATNNDGDFRVRWSKVWTMGKKKIVHQIQYGTQVKTFENDMDAAIEFGTCVRHSVECAGKLDGR